MNKWIKVFAPASVANIGPGFDILGFPIEELGDIIEARKIPEKTVKISLIKGDNGKLSKNPRKNTAGIAALETLKKLNADSGVEFKLYKKTPLQSGTGGSGTSAVAGAYAVNLLFGNQLTKKELIHPCALAEAAVSGYHADNVAPSMLGGFVLIKGYQPLEVIQLGNIENLLCILAMPEVSVPTKLARKAIPERIPVKHWIHNAGNSAAIVAGVFLKDIELIGRSIDDIIVEPARAHLIPGFYDVKSAALKAGALGCSISGAGPAVFALSKTKEQAALIAQKMQSAFAENQVKSKTLISKISQEGAKQM